PFALPHSSDLIDSVKNLTAPDIIPCSGSSMDEPLFPLTLGVIGALLLGATIFAMSRLRGWRDRALVALVGAAGFVALGLAALRAFQNPAQLWNVNRLAVTVSMVKGY